MRVRRNKTQMTDRLWCMHRVMAEKIKKAYFDFENAHELDKSRLEKILLHAITKRSKYSHKPSA